MNLDWTDNNVKLKRERKCYPRNLQMDDFVKVGDGVTKRERKRKVKRKS